MTRTLIIGLGGIGSEILIKLAQMATDDSYKKTTRFIAFDTDKLLHQILSINSKTGKGQSIGSILMASGKTVAECLDGLLEKNEDEKILFPNVKHLYEKLILEGAGQVRAISYLAFLDTLVNSTELGLIHKAIDDLLKKDADTTTQTVEVYLICSIAGGTGAGLVLPLAMYLQDYFRLNMGLSAKSSNIYGVFVLPEIIEGLLKKKEDKDRTKINAYATLREINAFTLKGKGHLSQQQSDRLQLYLPDDKGVLKEMKYTPFKWCYLFDKENIDGTFLSNAEQYKNHIATCLYNKILSPMGRKAASGADNSATAHASNNQGVNCYVGLGSSEINYPKNDVYRYVSLKWAQEILENEWTMFDKKYYQAVDELAKSKDKKKTPPDQGELYIESVDEIVKRNTFAEEIQRASQLYDSEGTLLPGSRYEKYFESVKNYIATNAGSFEKTEDKNVVENNLPTLIEQRDSVTLKLDPNLFVDTHKALISYKNFVIKNIEKTGIKLANELFPDVEDMDDDLWFDSIMLENFLKDNEGIIMHPNSKRYFLYHALEVFKSEKIRFENRIKEIPEHLFKMVDHMMDDFLGKATDDIENAIHVAEHDSKVKYILGRPLGKLYMPGFVDEMQKAKEEIDEYLINAVTVEVLERGLNRLNELSKSYETFYLTFKTQVANIESNIVALEKKYTDETGVAVLNICASKQCLQELAKKTPIPATIDEETSALFKKIYNQVKLFSGKSGSHVPDEDRINAREFFDSVLENDIVGFFVNIVRKHSNTLDMDVFEAMKKEAELKGITDDNVYMMELVNKAKSLASPYISTREASARGRLEYTCSFDPTLYTGWKQAFIDEHLENYDKNATADSLTGKEKILFFRYIYNLSPSKLVKFAAPSGGKADINSGLYYNLYQDYIQTSNDKLFVTPHMRSNWHSISVMTDLAGTGGGPIQAYEALIKGLIFNHIRFNKDLNCYEIYIEKLQPERSGKKLYEVIETLNTNQQLLDRLISQTKNSLEKDFEEGIVYSKGKLSLGLENFKLLEVFPKRKTSIFEIATLYRFSTPEAKFDRDTIPSLIEHILDIINSGLGSYYMEEIKRFSKLKEIVNEQLDTLFTGAGQYSRDKEREFKMSEYVSNICDKVIEYMRDKTTWEIASEIEEKIRQRNKRTEATVMTEDEE
ncbi:MAG: tubulin-like doman-containing protein [Candidatus Cloacimonetes bacterium]|nr:tubulin-like doman-containing protein [Candidatus Cloacimonadota bacterium]